MEDVHNFEPGVKYRFVVRNDREELHEFNGMYWIYEFVERDGHNYLFRLLEISLNGGYIRRFHDTPLRSIAPEMLETFIITKVQSPDTSAPAAGGKRKTKKNRRKRNNKKKNTRSSKKKYLKH